MVYYNVVFAVFLFFLGIGNSWGQSATLSAGGDAVTTSGSFSYSLGQVAYEPLQNSSFSIFQGVQQPYQAASTNRIKSVAGNLNLSIYPNPTGNNVYIHNLKSAQILSFRICDAGGKIITNGSLSQLKTEIDLSNISPGVYFISFQDNQQNNQTYTLIKK